MKEKIGVVDAGGGLRDIYGAGVFDYLIDNNINLDYGIGVSAGSANIASYFAKQKGRNKVYYKDYSFRNEYLSFHNFITTGSYINLNYIYGTLSNEGGEYPLDFDTMMNNKSEMVVVASNAKTGKPEYIYKKDFLDEDEKLDCECERCFKKISFEEYELNDFMCEDCYQDVHTDKHGNFHDDEYFDF